MLKKAAFLFPLVIVSIGLNPTIAQAQSAVESGCYMQMPNGSSVNLSALCNQAPTTNSSYQDNYSNWNYQPTDENRQIYPTCHGSACGSIATSPGVYVNGYPVYPNSSTQYYYPNSNTQYYHPNSSNQYYYPNSSTRYYHPNSNTQYYYPNSSTRYYHPGSSSPTSATRYYHPGSSSPTSSTRYYHPGSSSPTSSTRHYYPGSPNSYPTYQHPSSVFPSTGRTYQGTTPHQAR